MNTTETNSSDSVQTPDQPATASSAKRIDSKVKHDDEKEKPSLQDILPNDDVLDEFRVDGKSFERGLPMTIGFKLLITCISFVLFAVIEVLLLSLLITKESFAAAITNGIETIASSVVVILLLVSVLGILFVIFLLVNFFSKKHSNAAYCVFIKRRGLFILLVVFFLIAASVAHTLTCFTDYHKTIAIATFIAALIAFVPIAIAWNVQEEERLKNFIDGFSKACSCMAFMGGAIAMLWNTFLA